MRKWLILAFLCQSGLAHAQAVWTWTDSNGTVHYSDRPVTGAREVQLSGPQTYTAPTRGATPAATEQPQTPPPTSYRTLTIASPAADETFTNIGGTLSVRVALDPPLAAVHRIDLYVDGQRLGQETLTTSFTLVDVPRGTHTLQAVIVDAATRAVIQRSEVRTFFVQQTSAPNPQVQGPTVRPPPATPRPGQP
jgi:hypothetical protein